MATLFTKATYIILNIVLQTTKHSSFAGSFLHPNLVPSVFWRWHPRLQPALGMRLSQGPRLRGACYFHKSSKSKKRT